MTTNLIRPATRLKPVRHRPRIRLNRKVLGCFWLCSVPTLALLIPAARRDLRLPTAEPSPSQPEAV
jgi:hypothetical protein